MRRSVNLPDRSPAAIPQALCLGLHRLEFGKIGLNFIGPLSHREELRL